MKIQNKRLKPKYPLAYNGNLTEKNHKLEKIKNELLLHYTFILCVVFYVGEIIFYLISLM